MDVSKINPDGTTYECKDATARKALLYSTTETDTGKTWIDNKPIYRKTFTGTAQGTFPLGVTNINQVINIYGVTRARGDALPEGMYPISGVVVGSGSGQTNFIMAGVRNNNTDLVIFSNGPGQGLVCVNFTVTIEYTKTTD